MDDPPEALDADERAELTRLRREVAELRMDRAFLKKQQLMQVIAVRYGVYPSLVSSSR